MVYKSRIYLLIIVTVFSFSCFDHPAVCASYTDRALLSLRKCARLRRRQAWRPSTRRNLRSAQTTFIQFTVERPSVDDIGAFVELLVRSKKATNTIKNYISAIKQMYDEHGASQMACVFRSVAWRTMIKGLMYTSRPCIDARTAMDRADLEAMVMCCATKVGLLPLRVALVFGYFGYLRISNMVPETLTAFDPDRSTTWAEVIPKKEGIILMLKWTKSLQVQIGATPVPLPALPGSILCPVKAWKSYTDVLPAIVSPRVTPLLLYTDGSVGSPITASGLRAMFNLASKDAGLAGKGYTPHSLRRGGATASFSLGVPVHNIKIHGTWTSDAVERYLIKTPVFSTPVVQAFKDHF